MPSRGARGARDTRAPGLAVSTTGDTRGATIVDWRREEGRADNVAILRRYDQAAFEALLEAALAAG